MMAAVTNIECHLPDFVSSSNIEPQLSGILKDLLYHQLGNLLI